MTSPLYHKASYSATHRGLVMQPIPGFGPSQPPNTDDLALLDEWYDDWLAADRSVESAQTYLRFLTHLAKVLAAEDKTLADATQADLKKFLRHIGEDRRAATRTDHTQVIRSCCNWLQDEYDIDSPALKFSSCPSSRSPRCVRSATRISTSCGNCSVLASRRGRIDVTSPSSRPSPPAACESANAWRSRWSTSTWRQ